MDGIRIAWGCCQNAGSDLVVLEWGQRVCISDKLPGDADAAGLWSLPSNEAVEHMYWGVGGVSW